MRAFVFTQVPDTDGSSSIAGYQFALVWMNDNIVNWATMIMIALNRSRPHIPYLDSSVLGGSDYPFTFALESYSRDIPRVTFECQDW